MLPKLDRVVGSFPTFYKQAVLTHLVSEMTKEGSAITFFNFSQGQVGFQLKESHLHKDAVWLYKWLRTPIGSRAVPEAIDFVKPWLKEFADVNTDVGVDKFGFPKDLYLPGNDLIVQKYMRARDRLHIFEPRDEMHQLLTTALGEDPRVQINKFGADTEEYFRSIMPCRTARALIYIELNQNSTYVQQLRAKNALHAILKRFPTATFLVTWDQHGDNMPWDAMEAFAQTGYKHCYASVQYSEKDYAERKVAEAIRLNNQLPAHLIEDISKNHGASVLFAPIITPDNGLFYPDSISAFKPGPNWEGAGSAVLNAGPAYGGAMQGVGDALRVILNKPNGHVYGRHGSLYEPHIYAIGGGDYIKQSYRNPGIALNPDYQVVDLDTIAESADRQFLGSLMTKMPYFPTEGGPAENMKEIAAEPYNLTPQGRALVESHPTRASKREKRLQAPTFILDAVDVYIKSMELQKDSPEHLEEYIAKFNEVSLLSKKEGKQQKIVTSNSTYDELNRNAMFDELKEAQNEFAEEVRNQAMRASALAAAVHPDPFEVDVDGQHSEYAHEFIHLVKRDILSGSIRESATERARLIEMGQLPKSSADNEQEHEDLDF